MQAFVKNFNFDSFLCYCSRLSIQGHTAESIKKHDEFVQRLWDDLTRKTSRKKSKLKDSSNFHKLSNEVIFLFEKIYSEKSFFAWILLITFLGILHAQRLENSSFTQEMAANRTTDFYSLLYIKGL
mgnify:CR=1 FL=1